MLLQTYLFFGIFLLAILAVGAFVLRKKKQSGVQAAGKIQKLVLLGAVLVAILYTVITYPRITILWQETPQEVVVVTGDERYTLSSESIQRLEDAALYCGTSRLQGMNRTMAGPVTLETPEGETLVVLRDSLMRRGIWVYKGDYRTLLRAVEEEIN